MRSSPWSALNWMPRSHLKKIIIGSVILMIVLVSTVNIEVEYYTWRNRLDLEVSDLHMITTGSSSSLKPTTSMYGIYMYLGCTVSPFASVLWHVTQAVKVCDLSNSDRMCDVKMSKDYDYDELGLKAQEWLQSGRFSQIVDQNEVIVKLDDDTIVSKDVLDDLVDAFIKSDCKFAGAMREADGFFWSSGPLFLVKTDYLKQQLRENGAELQYHKKHEDVQMSALLALQDRKSVCNIDVNTFKHRYYEDNRMLIRYKPYVKC
ncbi:hypothetical protein KI688_007921 [Linnemannia hyalina]|uniref:Uncharacterized protein n=1 Tax=Linnemannia hyalina TaxID=64524 RepID=A0A9P8BPF4_9FUNG|nr:hypothetical protein KI688_007921 [Linnemannia hyalina]